MEIVDCWELLFYKLWQKVNNLLWYFMFQLHWCCVFININSLLEYTFASAVCDNYLLPWQILSRPIFFFGLKYGDSDFSIHLPWNDKNSTSFVFRIQWHVCYVILDTQFIYLGSFWNGKDISKFPWHILHLYHCDINISTWRDQANISYVET